MKAYDKFKSMSIDELADWLDKYGMFDCSPWLKWFDDNYCSKCESETAFVLHFNKELECSWCELHGKCKYFKEMEDIPDNKQTIKMWLESDIKDD